MLTVYRLQRLPIDGVSAGYSLSLCTFAGDKPVKVVTPPWNSEVEPADVTLVVGRSTSQPVASGTGQRGQFFLKLHAQSTNPAYIDMKPHVMLTRISHDELLPSSPPVFFNSGDIFIFRKCYRGHPNISLYDKCESYNLLRLNFWRCDSNTTT
jgi:hypothetical protein